MKNSVPTISIVIPCYNLGAYLCQSVQSVLNQTFKDFEIIIIDDGSTDTFTQNLLASLNQPKCRIFRTENNGVMEARNLGIKKSKGRYISFLDADDLFEPQFLEKTVELLESDKSIAFASCWLKAFGNIEFLWNPDTCDFPHLLAEDTVCTASLIRKNAIIDVGAFDTEMPLPGYEDWELAINLVKHGFKGRIIPEYLFRYRIRNDSLSCKTIEPKNHDLLMRYIIDKHAEIYKNHYIGILKVIEDRINGLERMVPSAPYFENEYSYKQNVFLKNIINTFIKSRSWKITKPLRHGYGLAKAIFQKSFAEENTSNTKCSVIITCFNHDIELQSLIESVKTQLKPSDEIIIVDDGSTNPITLQILEWYDNSQIKIINTTNVGFTQASKIGLNQAKGLMLFALNANQTIEPNLFENVFKLFDNEPDLSFVMCGLHDDKTDYDWIPDSLAISDILACPRLGFPIIKRDVFNTIGSYDSNIDNTYLANLELIIRLVDKDYKGSIIAETLIKSRVPHVHCIEDSLQKEKKYTLKPYLLKHKNILDNFCKDTILGQDYLRQCLQFHLTAKDWNQQDSNKLSPINWGDLRRLDPISSIWGFDRGQPIDRYYIGLFLDKYRQYISGRVLEVKEPVYMQTYGQDIEKMDIVDIDQNNPLATINCDLSAKSSLQSNTYDCFIITQTIHIIYDIKEVINNIARTLRPGGVVLATLPCLSRVDYESGINGDYWRFTLASARKLFEEAFGSGQVEIQAYGNVMTSCAFLMGIAAEEISFEELNHHDQYFPLLICVKAVKS